MVPSAKSGSNRTFMELKLTMGEARGRAKGGSNRTFMELKLDISETKHLISKF